MNSYEEKLLAGHFEMFERQLLWPLRAPTGVINRDAFLWKLHQIFGTEIRPIFYMSIFQMVVIIGIIGLPTKLLFDWFLFRDRAFMSTLGYWEGVAFFLILSPLFTAILMRLVSKHVYQLSRWEEL